MKKILSVNKKITTVWIMVFMSMALCDFVMIILPQVPQWISTVTISFILYSAIKITFRTTNGNKKKYTY